MGYSEHVPKGRVPPAVFAYCLFLGVSGRGPLIKRKLPGKAQIVSASICNEAARPVPGAGWSCAVLTLGFLCGG